MDAKAKPRTRRAVRSEGGPARKSGMKYVRAVTTGLIFGAVLLIAAALVMCWVDIPLEWILPISLAALIFASMLSGFLAARQFREHGLRTGAVCGFFIFAILFFLSGFWDFSVGVQALLKMITAMISGAIGGVLGVNMRTARK